MTQIKFELTQQHVTKEKAIKLFHDQKVRVHWNDNKEKWYFSIVDVIGILAENDRPRKYWNDLKKKLKDEGSELSDFIGQLKMPAHDGKMRMTDEWDMRGINKGLEYAILTDEITKDWAGMTTKK